MYLNNRVSSSQSKNISTRDHSGAYLLLSTMSSEEKRAEQSSHESEHDQYLICEKKQDLNTEHRRAQCLQKRREENKARRHEREY